MNGSGFVWPCVEDGILFVVHSLKNVKITSRTTPFYRNCVPVIPEKVSV